MVSFRACKPQLYGYPYSVPGTASLVNLTLNMHYKNDKNIKFTITRFVFSSSKCTKICFWHSPRPPRRLGRGYPLPIPLELGGALVLRSASTQNGQKIYNVSMYTISLLHSHYFRHASSHCFYSVAIHRSSWIHSFIPDLKFISHLNASQLKLLPPASVYRNYTTFSGVLLLISLYYDLFFIKIYA